MTPATFTTPSRDAEAAVRPLIELGVELGPSVRLRRTVLDTFDGLLHADGLRLEHRLGGRAELVLDCTGDDEAVPAHVEIDVVPQFARELPAGPLRARLLDAADGRALLPQITVTTSARTGEWRDAAGKVVARVVLHDDLAVVADGLRPAELPRWTVELVPLEGYGKRARRVHDALVDAGLGVLPADTLATAAAAAGVDLAGFRSSPTVPLDARQAALDGVRLVLANLARTIDANWAGTIDDIDPEFLHDLRVAVRRSRSVLKDAERVLPPTMLDRARDRMKWLQQATGSARDLDTYLIEWPRYTASLAPDAVAALEPALELLTERRHAAQVALVDVLRSDEARSWMATWHTWLAEPLDEEPGDHAQRPLGRFAVSRIRRAQARLLRDGRAVTPETPDEPVHELRKEAKRLRYLIECFGGLFAADARKRFVKHLKALQDNLGEHQDAVVHAAYLADVAEELHADGASSAATLVALGQLTEQLEQRRHATRAEFAERFGDYDRRVTRRALEDMLDEVRW